jgi:hypothetical protein
MDGTGAALPIKSILPNGPFCWQKRHFSIWRRYADAAASPVTLGSLIPMVRLAVFHAEKDEAVIVSRPAGRRRAALATLAFAVTAEIAALGLATLPAVPANAATTVTAATAPATGPALMIYAGGDRTGDTAVAGLAGETFTVYAGTSAGAGAPVGGCTTGAGGTCSVPVSAVAAGAGYWVQQTSVPAGWLASPQLGAGPSAATLANYAREFVPGPIAGGQRVAVPVAAPDGTAETARGSLWAASRGNPALPGGCGLKVALVLDLSGAGAKTSRLADLKAAGHALVTALTGTASSVAVYTFGATAPAPGGHDGNLPATPVSTAAGAATVNARLTALRAAAGGTADWGQGLWQVASDPARYDLALVLTDGAGQPARFLDTENGIFSANALKAKGTRVVAMGAGVAGAGAAANLAAISGPAADSDYYLANSGALAGLVTDMAGQQCAGTVNVGTEVVPASQPGDLAAARPAPGWNVTASGGGVRPGAAVTDATGAVSFATSAGSGAAAAVRVAATAKPGYTLLRAGGRNATCRDSGGKPVRVTNAATGPGFTVAATGGQAVSCVVYEQQEHGPDPASVVVRDTWVIDGVSRPGGDQDPDFQSRLGLTPVGPSAGAQAAWGQESGGYAAGERVHIAEADVTVPPGCASTQSGDLGTEPLGPGVNSFRVTHTVVCTGDPVPGPGPGTEPAGTPVATTPTPATTAPAPVATTAPAATTVPPLQGLTGRTELTLVDGISDPFTAVKTAPLTSWTLDARPAAGGAAVLTGDADVTGVVAPGTPYLLTESPVPGYQQTVDPSGTRPAAGATGSWQCVDDLRGGGTGLEDFGGGTGVVVLRPGQHVTCTAVNLLRRPIPVGPAATGGGFAAAGAAARPPSWATGSGLTLIAAGALIGAGGLYLRRRGGPYLRRRNGA